MTTTATTTATTTTTTSTTTTPDRIEKQIVLRASPERVWRAISNAREFGAWFQANLRDDFVPGATVHGTITTKGWEHMPLIMMIERMERERLFSFRWHPGAEPPPPDGDHASQPTTLVEFRLEPAPEGTLLVITESGFDNIPAERRFKAFEGNSHGWDFQLRNIERHVA